MASNEKVYCLRFNQDQTCFVCATENGIRVFNVEPLSELVHIENLGSIAKAEMLYRSNLMALIPGGRRVEYPENVVLAYDLRKNDLCMDSAFGSKVLAVRLRRDRMVVVQQRQVQIYSFPGVPTRLKTFETGYNPKGLCELSPLSTSERLIMVFPGIKVGSIQIVDLCADEAQSSHPFTINAHQSDLQCIQLNQNATMVATASQKGTLIRVFDSTKRVCVIELRRGSDPATLYCINFSRDDKFLCCSSDKGTVHVFALADTQLNRRSKFSSLKFISQYVESQWALASFTVSAECACVCAFGANTERGENSTVYAVCVDGTFHKYAFKENGTCVRKAYDVFFDVCSHDKQEL